MHALRREETVLTIQSGGGGNACVCHKICQQVQCKNAADSQALRGGIGVDNCDDSRNRDVRSPADVLRRVSMLLRSVGEDDDSRHRVDHRPADVVRCDALCRWRRQQSKIRNAKSRLVISGMVVTSLTARQEGNHF